MTLLVHIGYQITVIVLLSLLNGLFASAELALLSIRRTRLEELAETSHRARTALRLRKNPERFLATVQVGITVVGATAGAFGGAALEGPLADWLTSLGVGEWAHRLALVLVVALVSGFTIVLGELVPKSLALRASERVALTLAPPIALLSWLARPIVWFLTAASNIVLRPFNDKTTFTESRISPDELQTMVEEAASAGTLSPEVSDIASRAIDLSTLKLSAVMIPRMAIVGLDLGASRHEIEEVMERTPHSRYPVFGEKLDDIAGYVIARELYRALLSGAEIDLEKLAHGVQYLPETVAAVDALRKLQQARTPLAMVVDENGSIVGLVTIEDVTEELVGDILAEHEQPFSSVHPEAEGSARVAGQTPIREINRSLGLELDEQRGSTTIAGLVVSQAERVPGTGDIIAIAPNVSAEVLEATPRQVRWVRLRYRVLPEESEPSSGL